MAHIKFTLVWVVMETSRLQETLYKVIKIYADILMTFFLKNPIKCCI